MISGRPVKVYSVRVYLYVKLCCLYFRNIYIKQGILSRTAMHQKKKKKKYDYISVRCLSFVFTLAGPLVSHLTVFSPRTATLGLVASRQMAVNQPSMPRDTHVALKFKVFCSCSWLFISTHDANIILSMSISFSFSYILSTTNMNLCLF